MNDYVSLDPCTVPPNSVTGHVPDNVVDYLHVPVLQTPVVPYSETHPREVATAEVVPLGDAHGYITSASGRRLVLANLHPTDVLLSDVVHALALQCRYNGHCRRFLSVAEHCVLVCNLAERDHGHGHPIARAALLHDAHEAFTGDFPSPLKRVVAGFKEFEDKVAAVVHEALRLPPVKDPIWAEVKTYDRYALHLEASTLFSPPPPWVRDVPTRYRHPIHCLSPDQARDRLAQKLAEYGWSV